MYKRIYKLLGHWNVGNKVISDMFVSNLISGNYFFITRRSDILSDVQTSDTSKLPSGKSIVILGKIKK